MGQVLQAGAGQAPARQAAVGAGIPKEVPADTINKVCASSIRAIEIADLMIRAGGHDARRHRRDGVDVERAVPACPKARFGYRLGNGEVLDHMVFDGLTSSFDGLHMVEQASHVSRELGISREEQDEWAYRSHQRAAAAQDAGRFDDEIVPVGDVVADEGDPSRHDAREAGLAPAGLRSRRDDDRRQRARRERRRLLRDRLLRGLRGAPRPRAAGDDPRPGLRRRRLRLSRTNARAGRRAGARRRRGSRSAT